MSAEDSAPDPPPGYRFYEPNFDVEGDRLIAGGWILAVLVLFSVDMILLTHLRVEQYVNDGRLLEIGVLLVAVVALYLIHELAHAAVGRIAGERVTMQFLEFTDDSRLPAVSPVVYIQGSLTRRETWLFYAAPMLVITPICLAVVVFSTELRLVCLTVTVLMVNTAGAAKDVRGVLETMQLPSDVVEYHCIEGRNRYYVPESD